jgi:hypothetical protein
VRALTTAPGAERSVVSQGLVEADAKDHVPAFIAAEADHVLPLFLMGVVLILGPGLASGKVDGLGIRGPGEGVHVVIARRDGKCLSAVWRNQKQLGDFLALVVARVPVFSTSNPAFGEKRNPLPVGRPSRRTVVPGLRQLDQAPAVAGDSVEPQIRAKDLLLPVSFLGVEYDRVAVGRKPHSSEADGIEEFVEGEFRLCILRKEEG